MRLLLDTHAVYWSLFEEKRLSARAVAAIRDKNNEIHVSLTNAWEMAIKVGLGKWPEAAGLINGFEREISTPGFRLLPITHPHVRMAGLMQSPHRDPFDRLLAAQEQIEGLTLVTADAKLASLGAPVLW